MSPPYPDRDVQLGHLIAAYEPGWCAAVADVPVEDRSDPSEQDRIGRRLAFLEAQIEAGDMEYELPSAHLDDCLALAKDCYKVYMSIDDSMRRIANQAVFDKLYLSEEGTVIGEPGEPFKAFFDPGIQTAAARNEGRAAESRSQTGNVAGLNNDLVVGPTGIEPMTSTV